MYFKSRTDGQSVHLTVNEFELMVRKTKKPKTLILNEPSENWHVIAVARCYTHPDLSSVDAGNRKNHLNEIFAFNRKNHLVAGNSTDNHVLL